MVNESKANDPRFWAKARASGAVENFSPKIWYHPDPQYEPMVQLRHRGHEFLMEGGSVDLGYEVVQNYGYEFSVDVGGNTVLVNQVIQWVYLKPRPREYVLVPGYVLGREGFKTRVRPITTKRAREDVCQLLEGKVRGHINFWD